MKKIISVFVYAFYIIFLWPFLFYKKYGNNQKIKIKNTIVVANHYSDFDSVLLKMLLFKNKVRFVATSDVKRNILTRIYCWSLDCFYVGDDYVTNIRFIKEATAFLKKGGNVVIFPEGVINPQKAGIFPFNEGYLILQKKASANILPVYLYPHFSATKKSKLYVGDIITNETLDSMDRYIKNGFVMNKILEYNYIINN
jgi:1-acyl-sn-glycerol-3-phosphate acyltransferase